MSTKKYSQIAKMALLTAAASALGLTSTVWAIPTLTLTETSKSNVHYSWSDGGPSGDLVLSDFSSIGWGPNSMGASNDSFPSPDLGVTALGFANDGAASLWKVPGRAEGNYVSATWLGSPGEVPFFHLMIASGSTFVLSPLVDDGATVVSDSGLFAVRFIDESETQPAASVPEGGATSFLLAMGLSGVGVAARRFKRPTT